MRRLLSIPICLLAASSVALGQYAYTSSNVAMTNGNIYASNYVEVDYSTSAYYYIQIWNGLLQDCNGTCSDTHLVASGWTYGYTGSASWSASRPLTNTYYTSYAEASVVEYYYYYDYYYQQYYYQDQYGYSLMSEGWGTPYVYVWAPGVYLQTFYQVVPLSLAWAVGNATTNPPNVGNFQLWSGETGHGGTGYWVLFGTALANVFGPTTASTDCAGVSVTPSYAAPNQVNLAFSIAGPTPVQTCSVIVWTPNGSSGTQLSQPILADLMLRELVDVGVVQYYAFNGDEISGRFTDDFLSDYAATMMELGYVDSTWPGISPTWTTGVTVLIRALGAQAALLAAILVQDGSSGRHFPQEKDLIANCVPGALVIEPATAVRFSGGMSYEQEYICPVGLYPATVFTIHWIVKNGKIVHGPHPRLGPPQGGGAP